MLETLLLVSAAVWRLTELLKPLVAALKLPDAGYRLIIAALASGIGVLAVFLMDVNLLADFTRAPQWLGFLVTGIVVGAGASVVHTAVEVVDELRRKSGAP